ncbi:MAG: carboxypeptidase regulatory-like domain-containing protein, partial [Acidimicrobiia bacterium]|nr:carboxypeptidase regulatory-like domain-containing protein [Acidimicrobiia bacterium]
MTRTRRSPLLVLAVALGLLLTQLAAPATATPAVSTATITGIVRDTGGNPLSGVDVLVHSTGFDPATSTVTGIDGRYEVEVPPGTYRIRFEVPGGRTVWYLNGSTYAEADPIELTAGEQFAAQDVTIEAGAAIAGHVRGPGGSPVAGATVWGFGPGDLWLGRARTTTDTDGRYVLDGLAELPYRIAVVPPAGLGLKVVWHDAVTPVAPGTTDDIDVALAAAATITGTVTDQEGRALSGVSVTAWSPIDTWVAGAGASTGPDGTYVIEGLSPGEYRINFRRADKTGRWSGPAMTRALSTPVVITGTETVAGIDSALTPAFAYTAVSDLVVPDSGICDPIASGCHLPFPSNRFTRRDPSTPTGLRVSIDPASMPSNTAGVPVDPTHWNELDGFSPSAAMLLQVPDVDLVRSGAAPVTDPARSLDSDSPVVLLDA